MTAGAAVPPELEQIGDDDLGYSVRLLPNLARNDLAANRREPTLCHR